MRAPSGDGGKAATCERHRGRGGRGLHASAIGERGEGATCERYQGELRSLGSHRCRRRSSHKAPVAKANMSAAITRHVVLTAA